MKSKDQQHMPPKKKKQGLTGKTLPAPSSLLSCLLGGLACPWLAPPDQRQHIISMLCSVLLEAQGYVDNPIFSKTFWLVYQLTLLQSAFNPL